MRVDILSIFPSMFDGPFDTSIVKRAINDGLISINVHDIRDWAKDKHQSVDDYSYGGGPGMVMKPEPIFAAISDVAEMSNEVGPIVILSPSGRPFTHDLAIKFSQLQRLIMVCGHYEGIDARVHSLATDEISLGDYVLSGGEIPAMIIVDAMVRHLPGALGHPESAAQDSFADGLLEAPPYTRPAEFKGMTVPDILLSGNHAEIDHWRRLQNILLTARRRPEMLSALRLTKEEEEWLDSNLGEL